MKRTRSGGSREKLHITWFGHSAFLIQAPNGKSILIDPWLDNPRAPQGANDTAQADLILLTHGHGDHLGNTIDIASRTGAKVVAIYEVYLYLASNGITNGVGMNKGGTLDIDGVKVTMTDARHSSTIDAGGSMIPGGEAAGFVIEVENGYKVYHAGDTCVFGDMKIIGELYKPDLAILPIGDLYTMGPNEAAYAIKLLKPKNVIGMHYGTFPALTGTPAAVRKLLPAPMRKHIIELEPGRPSVIL